MTELFIPATLDDGNAAYAGKYSDTVTFTVPCEDINQEPYNEEINGFTVMLLTAVFVRRSGQLSALYGITKRAEFLLQATQYG